MLTRRSHAAEIVREFVLTTECRNSDTAARIAGVGRHTYERWQHRPPKQMRSQVLDRIERFLGRPV